MKQYENFRSKESSSESDDENTKDTSGEEIPRKGKIIVVSNKKKSQKEEVKDVSKTEETGLEKQLQEQLHIAKQHLYEFSSETGKGNAERKMHETVNDRFFLLSKGAKLKEKSNSAKLLTKINSTYREAEKSSIRTNVTQTDLFLKKEEVVFYAKKSIEIDGVSARSVIIALSQALKERNKIPTMCFSIGNTRILFISNPTSNQPGNGMLKIIDLSEKNGLKKNIPESYGESTDKRLIKINYNNVNRGLDIYKLMRMNSRKMASFDGCISGSGDDVDFLNLLNFLRSVFEVARRSSRKNDDRSKDAKELDSLPSGIAQARTSELLMSKKIESHHAYGIDKTGKYYDNTKVITRFSKLYTQATLHNSSHGVFTGVGVVDNISEVKQKIARINDEYNKQYDNEKTDEKRHIIEGRRLLRKKLGEEFGSDNESDREDYSDNEMEELKDAKKIAYTMKK